jgi:hypothetical protein
VVSLSSVNSLQASLALAQRKVQQDQSEVQRDSERLDQSRTQLSRDRERLSQTQQESRRAERPALQAAAPVRVDRAIETPVPSQKPLPAALAQPQVNILGQTIGSRINVTA